MTLCRERGGQCPLIFLGERGRISLDDPPRHTTRRAPRATCVARPRLARPRAGARGAPRAGHVSCAATSACACALRQRTRVLRRVHPERDHQRCSMRREPRASVMDASLAASMRICGLRLRCASAPCIRPSTSASRTARGVRRTASCAPGRRACIACPRARWQRTCKPTRAWRRSCATSMANTTWWSRCRRASSTPSWRWRARSSWS